MIPLPWALIFQILGEILLALKILPPGVKRLLPLQIVELLPHLLKLGLILWVLLLVGHLYSFLATPLLDILLMCLYLSIVS